MSNKSTKLLVAISSFLFLALAFPVIAKEQSKKPTNTPPDLEKITFVHYAKSAKDSRPVDDTADIYKLMFGGIKWPKTMQYEVNSDGSDLDEEDVMGILGTSLETWDAKTGFELFDNVLGTTTEGSNSGDRINRVTWEDFGGPAAIAYNSFWFNTKTKEIVESDVVFNSYYDWSLSGESDKMDLQNIATHEFGHNGLNDLYMPKSAKLTMYGYSDFGDIEKRTLGTGDISGIQALYD